MSTDAFMLVYWFFICIGHACFWTAMLNAFYAEPLPKRVLKAWRLFTGFVIAAVPPLILYDLLIYRSMSTPWLLVIYFEVCAIWGAVIFPAITIARLIRRRPNCVLAERTETLDLGKQLGTAVRGDGMWRWLTRLPGNCVFKVDVTELSLKLPRLPSNLDGLSILLLSDLHFHGTPSKVWFDAIFDRLLEFPKPDVVVLAGDYVDTDTHREWIAPILGRLRWNEVGMAILGNHDAHHHPERTRRELEKCGYTIPSNHSHEVTIRGERCIFTGNESPWFPAPSAVPDGGFRICVSHSPDQFRWAQRHGFDLILCGHVHGGQIRLPIIGSIFVPSRYGRRYDLGVFEKNETVMIVGRGLSGKEPLRFRCHPQVIRMVLHRA